VPPRSGQMDEISQAIGRLEGSVKSVESYVHDGRHGVNNLSQKVDGLGNRITRDIAALEAKIQIRMDSMDERIIQLERSNLQTTTAKNIGFAVLQSPVVGWAFALASLFVAWWKGLLR
jgi:hypothetical protein